MKLIRFMSFSEFEKLIKGETLKNETKHKGNTNSVGFCFFEVELCDLEHLRFEIGFIYEYASGIVSEDVAVVFDSEDTLLKEGYGVYADPFHATGSFLKTEYSITKYNKEILKPLYFAIGKFIDNTAEYGE